MIWKYMQQKYNWNGRLFHSLPIPCQSEWFYKTLESATSAGWAQQRAQGVVFYSLPLKGRVLPST